MNRVFLADSISDERLALRLLLQEFNMQVVGEASDWATTLSQAPSTNPNMLMVDWELVVNGTDANLSKLRLACPAAVVIVLISHLSAA